MMARSGGPSLPLSLSIESAQPLYEQIEQQLRRLILSHALPVGTTLPSVRALASQLSCSVITTRRAYADLEAEGLIHTRQGIGTIVAGVSDEQRDVHMRAPVLQHLRTAVEEARNAGIADNDIVNMLADVLQEEP